ncbi:MAG: hypothetical protein ACKN9V_02015 [Pseudomonadota bacterium]
MMDPISSPLQGPLGYTLLGEILGVTSLSWVFVAMMLKKLRYESAEIVAAPEPEMIPSFKVEETPEYLALMAQIRQLEAEKLKAQESQSGAAEAEKMQKTISYLENKLLEYEIVQEEISTLGELKSENEKLKLELNSLKKQLSSFSEAPTPEPSAKDPMPEDIQTLLSDIESLSQDKQTKP